MANPQAENGHIDIANEIADKLCSYRLNGQEWQVIWVILRKTWGWLENPKDKNSSKKKMDRIALSQFAKLTGIDRCRCHAILKGLIVKKIIKKNVVEKFNTLHITYGFQKDFDKWSVLPKSSTVVQNFNRVLPKSSTKVLPKSSHTKDTLKETITKEIYTSNSIEFRLANYLFNNILKNNPNHKKPDLQKWAKTIDLILRIDKRLPNDVKAIIEWCQNDTPDKQPDGDWKGWSSNILSVKSLRVKFDQLFLKMQESTFKPKHDSLTQHNLTVVGKFFKKEGVI